ncbi:MAG TPA: fibronectin type III domain-containing protein [Candidatus Saccharimonadales bacterium]|nr:fibronectin type III domain-containing protein [Candidatus Saccharimonadales bacterium]
MNVSNRPKPYFLVVLAVIVLAIPLTVYLSQNTQVFQNFAWFTSQAATSECSGTTGTATINVSFTNTETSTAQNMDVVANDLQTKKFVDLGTVKAKQTKTAQIDTQESSLKGGTVVFSLKWSNGAPGTDSRSATYPAVSNCTAPTPTPPPNFCPDSGQNDQGLCKWDQLSEAQGYNVVVTETDNGTVVQSSSVASTITQVSFPMTPGKPYQCKVSATNVCGTGTPTTSAPVTCPVPSPSPTPPPTGPVCPNGSSAQGVCNWDAVSGATSYSVVIQDLTTGQNTSVTVQAPATQYSFDDNGVDTYQCNVSATNVCGSTPPTNSPPSTCTGPTPTPTPLPTATPTPAPTSTPAPTPTPVVIVRTVTTPPQQVVIHTPGQTQTIVQQVPGQTQTVVQQVPVVQQETKTQVPTTPGPTMPPTGNSTPTYILVGTSALLLLAGGLIFFIL